MREDPSETDIIGYKTFDFTGVCDSFSVSQIFNDSGSTSTTVSIQHTSISVIYSL